MSEDAVRWRNVVVTLGRGQRVLGGVSMSANFGSVLGIVGPNGAGKSTLFRATAGLVACEGEILVRGEKVTPGRLPAALAAMIEQPAFYPWATGRRNLELLAAARGIPAEAVVEALQDAGLHEARDRPVRHYSQGMRQRLGLAQVFLMRTPVVLLDEPATALDPPAVQWLRDRIDGLRDAGCAVVVASHVLTAVEREADAVAILLDGKVVLHASADEVAGRGGLESVFFALLGSRDQA